MITSFRAKDVSLPDESRLPNIRIITKANLLNAQWSMYRLRLVGEYTTGSPIDAFTAFFVPERA